MLLWTQVNGTETFEKPVNQHDIEKLYKRFDTFLRGDGIGLEFHYINKNSSKELELISDVIFKGSIIKRSKEMDTIRSEILVYVEHLESFLYTLSDWFIVSQANCTVINDQIDEIFGLFLIEDMVYIHNLRQGDNLMDRD